MAGVPCGAIINYCVWQFKMMVRENGCPEDKLTKFFCLKAKSGCPDKCQHFTYHNDQLLCTVHI